MAAYKDKQNSTVTCIYQIIFLSLVLGFRLRNETQTLTKNVNQSVWWRL